MLLRHNVGLANEDVVISAFASVVDVVRACSNYCDYCVTNEKIYAVKKII